MSATKGSELWDILSNIYACAARVCGGPGLQEPPRAAHGEVTRTPRRRRLRLCVALLRDAQDYSIFQAVCDERKRLQNEGRAKEYSQRNCNRFEFEYSRLAKASSRRPHRQQAKESAAKYPSHLDGEALFGIVRARHPAGDGAAPRRAQRQGGSFLIDLRLFCVVTSFDPLLIYLFHDGLVRFSTAQEAQRSDQTVDLIDLACVLRFVWTNIYRYNYNLDDICVILYVVHKPSYCSKSGVAHASLYGVLKNNAIKLRS